jgi:hypothetical protein
MTPAAKKAKAIKSQMTPQTMDDHKPYQSLGASKDEPWDGKHPQIRANAEASELFTLRAMVSSIGCQHLMGYQINMPYQSRPKERIGPTSHQ